MKQKFSIPYFPLLLLAVFFAATGCGDEQDPRISNEDAAYLKQKRLQELYAGSTGTVTSTSVSTVTVTNTVTVDSSTVTTTTTY